MTIPRSSRSLLGLVVLGTWGLACRAGKPDSVEGGTRTSAAPVASSSAPPPAPPASIVPGPASSNAPRVERERAITAILRGETQTSVLPIAATDNGGPVDPSLRDLLAPRKQTVVGPASPVRPLPSHPGFPRARAWTDPL